MKTSFVRIVLGVVMFLPLTIFCEPIDFSRLTCRDIMKRPPDDVAGMMMWLDGFWAAKTGGTHLDFTAIGMLAKDLGSYCQIHSDEIVLDVVHRFIGVKK